MAINHVSHPTKNCGLPVQTELLPSFFIIGPPRTGTSWLHQVLSKWTLLPRFSKETRFFDVHFHRGLDWYRAHYRTSAEGLRAGEVAPTYFASSRARERIACTISGVKVVCIFRNPVDRVLSLYRVKRAYGLIPWNFEQALMQDPELTESGKYASNLKAWQQTLGGDRVLATIYDDLLDEPQSYVDRVADFIGIPHFRLAPAELRRVHGSEMLTQPRSYHSTRIARSIADWCKAQQLDLIVAAVRNSPLFRFFVGGGPAFSELSPETSLRLYERFRPEVEELESILNRDFSAWKFLGAGVKSMLIAS